MDPGTFIPPLSKDQVSGINPIHHLPVSFDTILQLSARYSSSSDHSKSWYDSNYHHLETTGSCHKY